jgi:hypothetical protein
MKWVTWENVGVDRMACGWLIRHFIDPRATFHFVPEGETTLPKGATAFDIPGAKLSHKRGHCSFHTMLDEYKLKNPILRRIARIVDEADTVQDMCIEPAAQGLDLLCKGIRLTSPDDRAALDKGAMVYDALYAALSSDGA